MELQLDFEAKSATATTPLRHRELCARVKRRVELTGGKIESKETDQTLQGSPSNYAL